MNKEKLLELGLTEDQAKAVLEGFKGYVPPERFNEVNEAKKAAEALVSERDKQIEGLKKSTGNSEALKSQIEKLQSENKAAKEKYEADIKTLKINNAIDSALTKAGAKNLKAVRALLDMEKITIEGDEVKGIDDQIKGLSKAEDSSFLFNVVESGNKTPKGMKPHEGSGKPAGKKSYSEMTYTERVEFLANGGVPE